MMLTRRIMTNICKCFSVLFILFLDVHCALRKVKTAKNKDFQVILQWQFLNFSWPTLESYNFAVNSKQYIAENNAPTGMKIYKDKIFLSIPRTLAGVPATLAYVPVVDEGTKSNELLEPFPSWEMNTQGDCEAFQSVQSMEIDKQGHMWVIDGVRQNEDIKCPAKLVILDLNKKGRIINKYTFPNKIALAKGGLLNDIVLDGSGGGFAYITDSGFIDPGLIVYSRKEDHSWKLRDPSFFADLKAANFKVNGTVYKKLIPIDGIALSPASCDGERKVFFCALTALKLYSINTSILKNQSFVTGDQWHTKVELIGKKESQSDGIVTDSDGNLYYTLLTLNGIGKWNISKSFDTAKTIYKNDKKMIWPGTFSFDMKGYLYVLSNKIYEFTDLSRKPKITGEFKFKIFKRYTGTKNYMY